MLVLVLGKHEEEGVELLWTESDELFLPVGTDTLSCFLCVSIDSVFVKLAHRFV